MTEQVALQNVPPFAWDAARTEAAYLLAEGRLTKEQVAAKVGVERHSITRWLRHPHFRAKVEANATELGDAVVRRGIARRVRRVQALDDRWERMKAVIDARAADPSMQGVPGGRTGLLVRTAKSVGSGPSAREVEEYAVDTGLLRELREHEKQAAQELGQWVRKGNPTNPDGPAQSAGLTDEQLAERILGILGAARAGGAPGQSGVGGDDTTGPAGGQPAAHTPPWPPGVDVPAPPFEELERPYLEALGASGRGDPQPPEAPVRTVCH
jgi:hypothetical protein